ncbi:endonuclease-reverse transcriptase [Trichonephila clavipes]|nr:endonuclease-reverse transcriptase [Trichonephila clavipes]
MSDGEATLKPLGTTVKRPEHVLRSRSFGRILSLIDLNVHQLFATNLPWNQDLIPNRSNSGDQFATKIARKPQPLQWLYKEPQVTQVIRSNRLRWLGPIWRSPENNQTSAYTFKNPMGSRTRGRPPTRWIDDVENDLKTLNIKNWQRVATYRWNWKKRAVEAAKTCNRLLRL